MVDVDPETLDAKVEAERARLVRALRALADRLETLPLDRVSEALAFLATSVDTLVRWAERMLGGARGGSSGGRGRTGHP